MAGDRTIICPTGRHRAETGKLYAKAETNMGLAFQFVLFPVNFVKDLWLGCQFRSSLNEKSSFQALENSLAYKKPFLAR